MKDISIVSEEELKEFHKQVSQNVKKFRTLKKKPQLDLVLEMGIKSTSFYSKCENSKDNHHFNLSHLYSISKALDIPLEELIKLDN